MKIANIQLVFLLGLSRNMLVHSNNCTVPTVSRGYVQEAKYSQWYWDWRKFRNEKQLNYINVPPGNIISSGTKLWLFCHRDSLLPMGERNVSSVTCSQGKWIPVPKCHNGTCQVPHIQNGEFGRYTSSVSFERVNETEVIKDEETLTLRCHKGYVPFPRKINNSKGGFFEEETTCVDGMWSKYLSCHSSSCGYPPRIKYGYPVVGNIIRPERNHGAVVAYVCRDDRILVERGTVVCRFGEWVGVPPECMDDCNTNDLEGYYDGLKIPKNMIYKHSETLHISCYLGYSPIPGQVITCYNGAWETPDAPCIKN